MCYRFSKISGWIFFKWKALLTLPWLWAIAAFPLSNLLLNPYTYFSTKEKTLPCVSAEGLLIRLQCGADHQVRNPFLQEEKTHPASFNGQQYLKSGCRCYGGLQRTPEKSCYSQEPSKRHWPRDLKPASSQFCSIPATYSLPSSSCVCVYLSPLHQWGLNLGINTCQAHLFVTQLYPQGSSCL